jgi:hypothetical protein
MANNLTGDYEAVLQISVRQINGILATMHQNRMNPDASRLRAQCVDPRRPPHLFSRRNRQLQELGRKQNPDLAAR